MRLLANLFGKSPPVFKKPRGSRKEWSTLQVGEWLKEIGLGEYKENFVSNFITGELLAKLTKDDMKDLGVEKVGHRLMLTSAIQKKISEEAN